MENLKEVLVQHIVKSDMLMDSRLLAKKMKYEHASVKQAIRRNKNLLETKSTLLLRDSVSKHSTGASKETYYMLTEFQCIVLTGLLKNGEDKNNVVIWLTELFLEAIHRVQELEKQLEIEKHGRDVQTDKLATSTIVDHYSFEFAIRNAPSVQMKQALIRERAKKTQEAEKKMAKQVLGSNITKQIEESKE